MKTNSRSTINKLIRWLAFPMFKLNSIRIVFKCIFVCLREQKQQKKRNVFFNGNSFNVFRFRCNNGWNNDEKELNVIIFFSAFNNNMAKKRLPLWQPRHKNPMRKKSRFQKYKQISKSTVKYSEKFKSDKNRISRSYVYMNGNDNRTDANLVTIRYTGYYRCDWAVNNTIEVYGQPKFLCSRLLLA